MGDARLRSAFEKTKPDNSRKIAAGYFHLWYAKRIYITPRKTKTIKLKNGKYTVSASVEESNIKPYWGTEDYNGYEYSSKWYIQASFGGY